MSNAVLMDPGSLGDLEELSTGIDTTQNPDPVPFKSMRIFLQVSVGAISGPLSTVGSDRFSLTEVVTTASLKLNLFCSPFKMGQ